MPATLFSLEAVFAKKGDCLILHYGPAKDPKMILIDAGPAGVFRNFLKPRLDQIREELALEDEDPVPFEMVMVSHIDDDHINGILQLFNDVDDAKRLKKPVPYRTTTLWHNSFGDLLGNAGAAQVAQAAAAANAGAIGELPPMKDESMAVIASTPQGLELRNLARKLKLKVNVPFKGLVKSPAKPASIGSGLTFTVVGPDSGRIKVLQAQWKKDLEALKKKKKKTANVATFSDDSPYNLASICVLATLKKKSMLLTGDARGDFVIEGLERAKKLTKTKPLHVDLLKVPHHGSDRNVEDVFFERITANHYVISGDGQDSNPEADTLEMIRKARGSAKYTIHFTFKEDAHTTEKNKERKRTLKRVADWVATKKPKNCSVVFQNDDTQSVLVNLLDPL